MAEDLDIKKSWFHGNHYDIPRKRIEEIKSKCSVVISSKIIVGIINGKVTEIFPYMLCESKN